MKSFKNRSDVLVFSGASEYPSQSFEPFVVEGGWPWAFLSRESCYSRDSLTIRHFTRGMSAEAGMRRRMRRRSSNVIMSLAIDSINSNTGQCFGILSGQLLYDIFISPPLDITCNDEDSGKEEIGLVDNLSWRQLEATTELRFKLEWKVWGWEELLISKCSYTGQEGANRSKIAYDSAGHCTWHRVIHSVDALYADP